MAAQMSIFKSSSIPYSRAALINDLDRLHDAWDACRGNRHRAAIYDFLTEVFNLIRLWKSDYKSRARVRTALRVRRIDVPNTIEPFAGIIFAGVHPTQLDRRTVSKWSRVLRYAYADKLPCQSLQQFVQRRGGINACATRFTQRHRRHQDKRTLPGDRWPRSSRMVSVVVS